VDDGCRKGRDLTDEAERLGSDRTSARFARLPRSIDLRFLEPVARRGVQIQIEHLLQGADLLERFIAKGRLAIECVQDDSLDQIAERDVLQIR
jgi:hypothetical protein